MWFIQILVQLFTAFVLLFMGMKWGSEYDWELGSYALYWFFYIIINIVVLLWRMAEPGYDAKADVKQAFWVAKKCRYCMKKLPSYFTSKCPHCTSDL